MGEFVCANDGGFNCGTVKPVMNFYTEIWVHTGDPHTLLKGSVLCSPGDPNSPCATPTTMEIPEMMASYITRLPVVDYGAGRGMGGYPFYAIRPNMAHGKIDSRLGSLLPQRPYCHRYKFTPKHPTPYGIIPWQDLKRAIRWYRSKARTNFRHPVKLTSRS